MKWTKLEYNKWPTGEIVLMTVSDNGYVNYEVGRIEIYSYNNEVYFIENKDGLHTIISIDSIYDLEPHYIKLDDLEMPL